MGGECQKNLTFYVQTDAVQWKPQNCNQPCLPFLKMGESQPVLFYFHPFLITITN